MSKYQEALNRIKNKKVIIDGEKMTIGQAYSQTFPILQELVDKEILMKEFTKQDKQVFDIFKEYIICDYVKEMSFDTYITSQCSSEEEKIFSEWYKNNKKNI